MSTVNPATVAPAPGTTQPPRTPGDALGKDDFLKLLVAQMRNQDPMNAAEDPSQQIAQMAQFSMLEQMTNIAQSQDALSNEVGQAQRVALIGRTVAYTNADGARVEGVVQKVSVSGDQHTLTVGGVDGIDPDSVIEVR